ncbi:MAG: hypothetical protein A2075_09285 [Geobacteraceae bacterium GWC2_58_44]|nr:MAG: hypothetical protein A2075_09285 [Geobacteraceae bacterium GWC2_58_44]HBG07706.1 hypothetical protein [Geobacter sp.]
MASDALTGNTGETGRQMTLDHEDIAAIAVQMAPLLAPLLASMLAGSVPLLPLVPSGDEGGQMMTDHELVMLMSQTDPLKAIREREKRLRDSQPRKGSRKRKAA